MIEKYSYYTLGDFYSTTESVTSNDSLFVDISESELLSFKDVHGYTNLERIFNQYPPYRKVELRDKFQSEFNKINLGQDVAWSEKYIPGTVIAVPKDKLNRAVIARDGGVNQVVGNNTKNKHTGTLSFLSDEINKIINNDKYQQTNIIESNLEGSTVTKSIPNARVKIWSRAMSYVEGQPKSNEGTELLGRWIDVSRYVQVLQTHTDQMGGNFSFTLVPVMAKYNEASKTWEGDRDTIDNAGDDMVAQSSIFTRDSEGKLSRGSYIFNLALQENDVIYIAFEPLALEIDTEKSFVNDGVSTAASDHTAPWGGGLYDMIGLIDNVSQVFTPGSNDISIEVQGRDLSKLLIEDGSYMYSSLWEGHNFFLEKEDGLLRRSFGPGAKEAYAFYSEPRYRGVAEAVLFIVNVLANVTICPDETTNGNSQGSLKIETIEKSTEKDKFKIKSKDRLKKAIQRARNTYKPDEVVDNSGLEEEAVIESIAQSYIAFAESKKAMRESSGSNYDIRYNEFMTIDGRVGFPITDPDAVISYRGGRIEGVTNPTNAKSDSIEVAGSALDYVDTSTKDTSQDTITQSGDGIWRSVKLAFDENIKDRKLVDVSLGTPDGSLLDLIFNYAQSPWIETIMDTYNKHWHMIFRMPPFDKIRVNEFVSMKVFDNVFVEDKDVLNESLDWESEVYSLYQLDYKAATFGNETLFSIIPTVPLPDYAEMYGTRRWRGSSNLVPVSLVDDAKGPDKAEYIRSQGIQDLTWIIETHSYLPFTRRGTITVNGDRRFKRGMWFHYRPTNEIFYITGVTHNFTGNETVDRTTILTVKRGMVLDYVTGNETISTEGGVEELSYFNIINIEKLTTFLKDQLKVNNNNDGTSESSQSGDLNSHFRVNKEVFNFFRTRSQFKGK